jgi:hypothetical protein
MMRPGRPQKPLTWTPEAPDLSHIVRDITFFLDKVALWLYGLCVPDRYEIGERMKQRLQYEFKAITSSRDRIKADIEAYHRVRDEMSQLSRRENRVKAIVGVLGANACEEYAKADKEFDSAFTLEIASAKELRNDLSLWEAMKEYLQHVSEARIGEMEDFFAAVEMSNANRQAMESALKRHPETFKIRRDKSKREKYISLKDHAKEGA